MKMNMEILCFFAGIAFAIANRFYSVVFLFILLFFRPKFSYLISFLVAALFASLHVWWTTDKNMPHEEVIKRAHIKGYIASIPSVTPVKTQFQFEAVELNGKTVKAHLLLSCYDHCPSLKAGQYWQLSAKIKRPRNLGNPGGFDYVSWLKARHITWTGYVKRGSFKLLEAPRTRFPLLKLREALGQHLQEINPDEQSLGILQALTLGISNHIDKGMWDLFRRTGTTHLMVISGAHIGLVAGLTYVLIKGLWCRFNWLCVRWPAPRPASLVALFFAGIYALLAGFGIPAQRALIVCFFMLLRYFCSQRFSIWQAWRYALLTVLLFEPHSVLMPGFYLSFIAVAILLLTSQRIHLKGIRKTITIQLACMVGLMPLTLFLFSYGAVNGFVANLIAIPWVGFIIIPLALLTTFLAKWTVIPGSLQILHFSITTLLSYLHWVDSFARINLNLTLNHLLSPIAFMVALGVIVLLPSARLLPVALSLMIAAMFPAYETVKSGDASVDVVDVGQGLAVLVRTANHVLVYDTGVKFYRGGDMGKLALIPYLTTLGVKAIDKVVISHFDLDHRGGLSSLEQQYSIGELIVDRPHYYRRGTSCHRYPSWEWDGVTFQFFPIKKRLKGKNNHSCVLQIASKNGKMLLTGDIEKKAEQYLVEKFGSLLQSSVLLVPHHSSKTSSSQDFLEQVSPRFAVSSYGFDNRYHFPHASIKNRYLKKKIPVYNTADSGLVRVLLSKGGDIKLACTKGC